MRSASRSTVTTTCSRPSDLQLSLLPLEGYQLEREGTHAVALELALDDELRREGWAREAVHAVQSARKVDGPGGRGPDRAAASAATTELLAAVRDHERYVAGETLATSITYDGAAEDESTLIEGRRAAHQRAARVKKHAHAASPRHDRP